VVAQPFEACWELVVLWFSVRGPFVAQGAKGGRRVLLELDGGTSEFTSVGKQGLHGAHWTTTQSCHLGLWYIHFYFEW
jgi:hypothetical protein